MLTLRSQAAADQGSGQLWQDEWDPRELLEGASLSFLCNPQIEAIHAIEYHDGNAVLSFRTSNDGDMIQAVDDFSLHVFDAQQAFAQQVQIPGNHHWGTVTDIEMLAQAMNVGFIVFPVTKQGAAERPDGWVYGLHLHRGNFTHWMLVYCIQNTHFQLAWVRSGNAATYKCIFSTEELPQALRDQYNLNNVHAPIGSGA